MFGHKKCHVPGGGNSNMFFWNFHPKCFWEVESNFDLHIFCQLGWLKKPTRFGL